MCLSDLEDLETHTRQMSQTTIKEIITIQLFEKDSSCLVCNKDSQIYQQKEMVFGLKKV